MRPDRPDSQFCAHSREPNPGAGSGGDPSGSLTGSDRGSSGAYGVCCECVRTGPVDSAEGSPNDRPDHRMPVDRAFPRIPSVPTEPARCGDFIPWCASRSRPSRRGQLHSATIGQPTKIGFLRRSVLAVARPECRREIRLRCQIFGMLARTHVFGSSPGLCKRTRPAQQVGRLHKKSIAGARRVAGGFYRLWR